MALAVAWFQITWADIYLFEVFYGLKHTSPHLIEKHPKLGEFINKVANEPKIRAWLEKRPKTEF